MVIIQGYNFEPHNLDGTNFNEVPGVYIVYTSESWLDVGETDKLASRLSGHERKDCWRRHANRNVIYLAFMYVAEPTMRVRIEQLLRGKLSPLCGQI